MLATNQKKLICTIGPASESPAVLRRMNEAGMHIARVNYSPGDFCRHKRVVEDLRRTDRAAVKALTILGDLLGRKLRLGHLAHESIQRERGDGFTLISRFKMRVWIAAVSRDAATCQGMQFSYGVQPVHEPEQPTIGTPSRGAGTNRGVNGPLPNQTDVNHWLEIIALSQHPLRC